MGDAPLLINILKELNIAVLKRIRAGTYVLLGDPPPFYPQIFPSTPQGFCVTPWEHSHMLSFFFEAAEQFFAVPENGILSSGTWEEEGVSSQDQALVAEAMSFETLQVIVIRLLTDVYAERVAILRKAREQLLERRMLANDLEMYKLKSRMDGLTKILNRTTFMELLTSCVAQVNEPETPLSLIMLDIDDFKHINDTFGHQAGDSVLAALGQIMLDSLRRNDLVARYGGEEFITLIPYAPPKQLLRIAEKLRASVANYHFGESLPQVTVSVGCTAYIPGENTETFVKRVDLALYDAKHNGKNQVRLR